MLEAFELGFTEKAIESETTEIVASPLENGETPLPVEKPSDSRQLSPGNLILEWNGASRNDEPVVREKNRHEVSECPIRKDRGRI